MTEPLRPPDDEFVSAHLDGEASPHEVARVQADPAARARLAEFHAIQETIGRRVEVPEQVRERSIAAALEAFDLNVARPGQHATVLGSVPAPPPIEPSPPTLPYLRAANEPADLAARRAQKRRVQLLSAAAAVVVVLLIAGAVRVGNRGTTTMADTASAPARPTTTTTGPPENVFAASGGSARSDSAGPSGAANAPTTTVVDSSVSAQGSAKEPTRVPSTPPGVPPTSAATAVAPSTAAIPVPSTPPSPTTDLGNLNSPADLRRAVKNALPTTASTSSTTASTTGAAETNTAAMDTCDRALRLADTEIGSQILRVEAVYQGTSAFVLVYAIDREQHPAANGGTRIYAVDRRTCAALSNQTM